MSAWNMPPGATTNDIPGNGPDEECDCIHEAWQHDTDTGACLAVNPTFGPCPCLATPDDIRREQWTEWRANR